MRQSGRKSIMLIGLLRGLLAKRTCGVQGMGVYNPPTTEVQHYQLQTMSDTHEVTLLLAQWANGNERALDDLTPLVYRELRRLAASYLPKEREGHTLPTRAARIGRTSTEWLRD
jgi:hypothetical protein